MGQLWFGYLLGKAARDVNPAHEGHVLERLGIGDEARERVRPRGIAGDSGMQADGHHPPGIVPVIAQSV